MNAFVIGDLDMITGFRLVGVEGVAVSTVEEARHALSKAGEAIDIAVVILSEEFSTKMRDEIDKLRSSHIAPLIVEIPGRSGPSGEIVLTNMIRKAIGIEV
jgi:V/A-type H+-transporting ATPase subunit F